MERLMVCPICKESLLQEPGDQGVTTSSNRPDNLTVAPCCVTRCGHLIHSVCLTRNSGGCPTCQANVNPDEAYPVHFPTLPPPPSGSGDSSGLGRITLPARRRNAFGAQSRNGPPNKAPRSSPPFRPNHIIPYVQIFAQSLQQNGISFDYNDYIRPQDLNQVNYQLNLIMEVIATTPDITRNYLLLANNLKAIEDRDADGTLDREEALKRLITRMTHSFAALNEEEIREGVDGFAKLLESTNGWLEDL